MLTQSRAGEHPAGEVWAAFILRPLPPPFVILALGCLPGLPV